MRRIGITQRVAFLPDINEHRDCLDQAWTLLLQSCGCVPVLIPNKLNDIPAYISQSLIDGVIFSGGNDLAQLPNAKNVSPERDQTESVIYQHCLATNTPLLGVCRGMQFMLAQDGVMPEPITRHVATKHVVKATASGALQLPDTFETNSFHTWGFPNFTGSSNYALTAQCDDGSAEAIEHRTASIAGIMWHPERNPVNQLSKRVLTDIFRLDLI